MKAKKNLDQRKKGISRAKVIADYRRVKKKLGRVPTYTEMRRYGEYGYHSLYRLFFNGYKKFLMEMNEKTHLETSRRENLTKEFYRIKKTLGRLPTSKEFSTLGKYTVSSLMYRYGNWANFLRSLGEVPRKPGNQVIPTDLVFARREFANFVRKNKREPTSTEFTRLTTITYGRITNNFGGWNKFLVILRNPRKQEK